MLPAGQAACTLNGQAAEPLRVDFLLQGWLAAQCVCCFQVVIKLFHIVEPDWAFFGAKDYQQLQVIKRLVRDLDMAVQVAAVPIMREPDGLAMSRWAEELSSVLDQRWRQGQAQAR